MPRVRPATLFVAIVAATYAAFVLWTEWAHQPSADSLYHFAVGREIAHGAIVPDVARSLPFTVLRELPVDHYWGYHALLALFAWMPDADLAMKIATVVLFAAIFVAIHVFLAARGVRYAWAWALLPALFSTQDWRYLQLRGGELILPLLFLLAHVGFFEERARRRRAWLFGIGYVALLAYHGGVALLPFHVGGVLALFALRRGDLARGQLFEPAITAAGMATGLTLNPYMDARASTWRFFALHVGQMGQDTAHLYDDQEIAEFHGFPWSVVVSHPEWLALLALTLAAIGFVAWRALRGAPVGKDAIVLAGMALVGIALTSRAMRAREYAVPVAFALFAVLAPKRAPSRVVSAVLGALVGPAFALHAPSTLELVAAHLPMHLYGGARAVLEANGDRPILNIAEADYCTLRWEWDRVVVVQALSRYFIYPYKELFHDVWELHDRADTSPESLAILRRFSDRGVALVATHAGTKMMAFAEAHPAILHAVFRSPVLGPTTPYEKRAFAAAIYAIDRPALDAALAAGQTREAR
jgi:hypothetical protein